jgi:hypothetical protein
MALIPGTIPVTGTFAPTDSIDTFAIMDMKYVYDGLRNVANNTERNEITNERRNAGMIVGTKDSGTYWKLLPGPWTGTDTDWEEWQIGGSGVTFLSELDDVSVMSPILDGDVLTYDGISGQWINAPIPATPPVSGNVSIQSPDDKFLNAISTSVDGDPATIGTISNTPVDGCYVEVRVNGTEYEVGNGVTNKVCYFANPATPTIPRGFSSSHPNGQIQAGDMLYWNGSIVGFQLLNGWRVSFHYLTL